MKKVNPFDLVVVAPIVMPENAAIDRSTGEIIMNTALDVAAPYDKDTLLLDWRQAAEVLAKSKTHEMDLRQKVVATFSDPTKETGTENIDIGNDWIVKVAKKLSYNFVSRADGVSVAAAVRAMTLKLCTATRDAEGNELNPELGKLISSRIKWAPEMSLAEYKALLPGHKAIVDEVMEIKPGSPTVTLVDPAEKVKRK